MADGPTSLEWLLDSATGSFLDGGVIRQMEIYKNNNLMSLDAGSLPTGTYSLSIPCVQQEADGSRKTTTFTFKVNVR
jgi:hypothetical protein